MSTPNINQSFPALDGRYSKPSDVASAIQAQVASDSATYLAQAPAPNGTNDTSVVQALINAAGTAGGGSVRLQGGTYLTTGLTIRTGVELAGLGMGATMIKLINGANADVVQTANFSTLTGTGTNYGTPARFSLRRLTLDANRANNTSGWAFRSFGCDFDVEEVIFQNGASGGVWSEFGINGSNMESRWRHFRIYNSANVLLDWNGPHDSQFHDGITNNDNGGPSNVVFGIRVRGNAAGDLFSQVHSWGNFTGFSWYVERPIAAVNCYAEPGAQGCIMLGASGSRWAGQVYSAVGGGHGIQIGDDNAWGGGVIHQGVSGVNYDVRILGVPQGKYPVYFPSGGSAGGNRVRALITLGGRLDSCTMVINTPTISDASAVSSDVGKTISGPGIPYGTTIISVVSGTSITMSANAQVSLGNRTLMIGGAGALMSTTIPNTADTFELIATDLSWLNYFAEGGAAATSVSTTTNQQGRKFYTPVLVSGQSGQQFRVTDGTTDLLYVNGASKQVQFPNGVPLIGFKDGSFSTAATTIKIDPATGGFQPGTAAGGLGARIFSGSGVPTFSAFAGDTYIRSDDPTVPDHRRYVCLGGTTWVADYSYPTIQPANQGLCGWSVDPAATSSNLTLTSGLLYFIAVRATDTRTLSNLWVHVFTAGSGLTTGQSLLGLYDSTGTLLATSGDQSTAWATTGAKAAAISASVTAGNTYYVGVLSVGTTPPALSRGSGTGGLGNLGLTSAPYRFNTGASGQTAMPSSVTPSSLAILTSTFFAAIS